MSENWLHISPTSGTGTTQMTISADTNNTTKVRRAKIIITAGTLSKSIEVVQYPMEGDIICTYNQPSLGVVLASSTSIFRAAVVSSEYGSIRYEGDALSALTSQTIYDFDGRIPSSLNVNYYLNSSYITLQRDVFSNLPDLVSVSILGKVNALTNTFYNNNSLKSIYLNSGVVYYDAATGDDYPIGCSVTELCPNLYEFTGESPLIYSSNYLVFGNKLIGVTLGSLTEVNVPNTVTAMTYGVCAIPTGAQNQISKINLPNTLTTIDNKCFAGLYITGITIPSGVTYIGREVFKQCTQLTSITATNEVCSAITIFRTTFHEIATGGTLYHPDGSDYASWLSPNDFYLGYYYWVDATGFQLQGISSYFLQFGGNETGSGVSQSVFITTNSSDYQLNISPYQSTTGSGVDWLAVSGTPAAGNTEFKIYPTTTASTQRNVYVHVVYKDNIYGTITVQQQSNDTSISASTYFLQFSSGQTGTSNYQSVYITSNKSDYQINVSDSQTTTASTQTSWLTVSGTPASGITEFRVYPTSTSITQRNCYIHIVEGGQIWVTITVIQLETVPSILQVTPNSLVFSGTANDSYSAQTLTIQSTVPYNFSQGADWFTVSGTPNLGYSVLQVYPTSNNWNNTRNSYIQFYYEGGYKNVTVQQGRANKPRIWTASTYFMATKLQQSGCNGQAIVIVPATGAGHTYSLTSNQSWLSVVNRGGGPASWWDFSGTSSTDYALFYDYVPEDNDTAANRSATLSLLYDNELITSKTVTQRAFGFKTNLCDEACEYVITVDADVTSYTFTVTSTTSFYCRKFQDENALTATCDGHTIVENPTSSAYNPSAGTHTISLSFPTGVDGEARWIGVLQFARSRGDFSGDTWNWYQILIRQLGNLDTGKYISATTTTITASSAAQTVSVPGFACNTFFTTYYPDPIPDPLFFNTMYAHDYFDITFEENTTGRQRSYTLIVNAEPVCDDGTGWDTPKTISLNITQYA